MPNIFFLQLQIVVSNSNKRELLHNWPGNSSWRVPHPFLTQSFTDLRGMPKTRHDFFSDPNWPYPDQTTTLPSSNSSSSENSCKDEERSSSITETANLDQALLELQPKSINPIDSIQKLKAQGVQEPTALNFNLMVFSDYQLLQSGHMELDSMEMNGVKVEEVSLSDLGEQESQRNSSCYYYNHYRILSTEAKQFLVKEAERTNFTYVSRKYGVSANNLYRWKKQCERKCGAGRKVSDKEMEENLIKWIKAELAEPRPKITRKDIQKKAIAFSNDSNFKASKGWFERFVKRNKQLDLGKFFGMGSKRISYLDPSKTMLLNKLLGAKKDDKEHHSKKKYSTWQVSQLNERLMKDME